MVYKPRHEYKMKKEFYGLLCFHEERQRFLLRPPYQRNSVWKSEQKQALWDSLFRGYFIPEIVLRKVEVGDSNVVYEVIDGQQRILAVREYFKNQFALPTSLKDIDTRFTEGDVRYRGLPSEYVDYVKNDLGFSVVIITGLERRFDPEHLRLTAKIFERVQEGEPLKPAEKMHARLTSRIRNFLVKYACNRDFNYETYTIIDPNPNKHNFWRLSPLWNGRFEHMATMARMLLLEIHDGPPNDLYIETVEALFKSDSDNGINDYSYEKEPHAQAVLRTLDLYFEVLKEHPKRDLDRKQGGLRLDLLRYQFVTLTVYLLLSKLRKNFALQAEHKELIAEYLTDYITKVKTYQPTQEAYKLFEFSRGKKAQSKQRMEEKDRILNRDFWQFVSVKGVEFRTLDKKRLFDPQQRIEIYERDQGICQNCKKEVPWFEYSADHIYPFSKGGATETWNGQVLCQPCNSKKGASQPN